MESNPDYKSLFENLCNFIEGLPTLIDRQDAQMYNFTYCQGEHGTLPKLWFANLSEHHDECPYDVHSCVSNEDNPDSVPVEVYYYLLFLIYYYNFSEWNYVIC